MIQIEFAVGDVDQELAGGLQQERGRVVHSVRTNYCLNLTASLLQRTLTGPTIATAATMAATTQKAGTVLSQRVLWATAMPKTRMEPHGCLRA
jgi:hypothetical protein